jgi:type II secretory pathway pseudopilin PulG
MNSMSTQYFILSRLCRSRARSGGFGLLQVLLLISVMAGLAAITYLQWRERSAMESSKQERQALASADRALEAFVTVMNRLPCPDSNRDGIEDCGTGEQKGWLPTVTLSLAGADAGVSVGQLQYLVQRGAGANDLTLLTDSWRPLAFGEDKPTFTSMRETAPSGDYSANVLTLTDFCQRLEVGRTTTYVTGMAGVNTSPVRSTAYALVHPGLGDASGNASLFDGANSPADSLVEDPLRRPLLAQYDDVVLERSHASLLASLHCYPLIDSINSISLGVDVIEQVHDMREENIKDAKEAIIFAALGAAMTAVETTATVLEGISDFGNAAADFALCAATLGFAVNACAAGGIHVAAGSMAGPGIVLNAASLAANIAASVMAGKAMALADGSYDLSKVCPAVDLSVALAAAQQGVTDARVAREKVEAAYNSKWKELYEVAIPARTSAIALLRSNVRAGASSTSIGSRIDTLGAAADGWSTAAYKVDEVTAQIDAYTQAVANWNQQVSDYQYMVTNRVALLVQLDNEIAALDTEIAAATTDAAKAPLQKKRGEKASQRALLNDPVALQAELDNAIAERTTAQANLDASLANRITANNNFAAAQGTYRTAFNDLYHAGHYYRYDASGAVITTTVVVNNVPYVVPEQACIYDLACTAGTIDVTTAVRSSVRDLFGSSADNPDPNAKYLRPVKLAKELAALETELTAARTREVDVTKLRDKLVAETSSPPPCVISGSAVTPMPVERALEILLRSDQKGGVR